MAGCTCENWSLQDLSSALQDMHKDSCPNVSAKKITDFQNINKIPLEQLRIEVESVGTESDHISVSTGER